MGSYLDELKNKYKKNENDEKVVQKDVQQPLKPDSSTNDYKLEKLESLNTNQDEPTEPISKKEIVKDVTAKINESTNQENIKEEPTKETKEDEIRKKLDETIIKGAEQTAYKKLNKDEILKSGEEKKEDFEKKWMNAKVITKYKDIEIQKIEGQALLHYKVPTPKSSPSQKLIINTLKEAVTRLISTDPYKIRDPIQRKNIYYQKIMDILYNAPEINIPKHLFNFYADAVVKEMVGFGVLEPLLNDDKLEEIMVIGPNKPTYIYHVDYGMMTTNIVFYSDEGIFEIIDKIARMLGRRIDISTPILDARLPDGSRVNATIFPASIDGATLTIRKFKADPYTITDLINFGTINLEVGAFLWCLIDGFGAKPANLVISGGTSSGKTTLLNILANFIPDTNRILTIEDTAELRLPLKHIIRFEGKPPSLEGQGELTLDVLVKNTLRMRPDRVIVGEIRHKEAMSLFTAMNTGHDGCMGTIHANSPKETLVRITSPPMDVPPLMLAGLDFIIVQKRISTSKGQIRRVTSISEISGVLEHDPKIHTIFKWNPSTDSLERTSEPIKYFEVIKTYTRHSDEDIRNILLEKINILKKLINNNIRDINVVSENIQNYYLSLKK